VTPFHVWFSRPPHRYDASSTAALALMSLDTLFTNINAEPLLDAEDEDPADEEFLLTEL
jgi:hypothetical protein